MVVFIISKTLVAIAQLSGNINHNNTTALNSTDSDGKNIIVTLLESNKTNANCTPYLLSCYLSIDYE